MNTKSKPSDETLQQGRNASWLAWLTLTLTYTDPHPHPRPQDLLFKTHPLDMDVNECHRGYMVLYMCGDQGELG